MNRANDGSVVPAVKLIKSMINSSIQSENSRLTGYHIDSLAIEAFKSYTGSTDLESMLDRFLTFAPAAVQTPIRDPSGQSRYVDEYLGGANSPERQRVANALTRLKRNFNACESELDLDDMFYTP